MTRRERGLGGIWIWLRADDGTGFYYAHLSRIAPSLAPGARVRAGQGIGAVGMTGDARGTVPHLHFEMHPPGRGRREPVPGAAGRRRRGGGHLIRPEASD